MVELNHFTVGVLYPDGDLRTMVAKAWGKKGTVTDIALYSISKPLVQTTVTPETYPGKVLSMVVAAHMSDIIVIGSGTQGIDANVGEIAILADTLKIPGVMTVVGENTAGFEGILDQMKKLFSKLCIFNYPSMMVDHKSLGKLRETVLEELKNKQLRRGKEDDELLIEVDHAFPVQGVGSVILGTVVSGTVEKGMKVKILPGMHIGTVKSIQVNDVDEREAGPGTHVGVALRGILDKNLSRGSILTEVSSSIDEVKELSIDIRPAGFGGEVKENMQVHVLCGLMDSPGTIRSWEKKQDEKLHIEVELTKKVPLSRFTRITILNMNAKQRIVGSRILE